MTSLINKSNIDMLSSSSVFDGYILYNINFVTIVLFIMCITYSYPNLMSLQFLPCRPFITMFLIAVMALLTIVIGGDFNCTENPAIDRLCMSIERRPKVAMTLKDVVHKLSLCDAWRRLNPNEWSFTWQRNNPNCAHAVSKSRLDRFYEVLKKTFAILIVNNFLLPLRMTFKLW